ncbi:MAG: carotenoid biosynthesis protein [Caldilineaceae bacterium]|nr:carotenoid biosynthesis protein [Caldilineaceae bacterium]
MSFPRPAIDGTGVDSFLRRAGLFLDELRDQMTVGSRVLLGLWLFLMILVPHVVRLGDRPTLLLALSLSVLLQVGLVLSLLFPALKGRATIGLGVTIIALAWFAEFVGHNTGFPFGRYTYTDAFRPQLGDVPVQIPLAWLMMLPPSWAVGSAISSKIKWGGASLTWKTRAVSSFSAGLAFTAWDLFLDPQMVAWGIWHWESPGSYFGVPIVNFAGWIVVAAVVLFGLSHFIDSKALPIEALLVVYTAVWFLNSVGLCFYFDLLGVAAAGFVGMGVFVALAWGQVAASPR